MTPIFAGGCIRYFIEKKYREDKDVLMEKRERGILFGSGLIAGVGFLMMILSVVTVIKGKQPEGIGPEWLGSFDSIFALLTFVVLGALARFGQCRLLHMFLVLFQMLRLSHQLLLLVEYV